MTENSQAHLQNRFALLRLMQLVSPALPVGAYAYSQGLEYAVDSQWLRTEEDACSWISQVMLSSIGGLDLPILLRCYAAWQHRDMERVNHWNNYLRASRETHELLLEDEQLGIALSRLLVDLDLPEAKASHFYDPPSFAVMFALAGSRWGIEVSELAHGFVWSWLENQIAAATKLVPLGQTQAQKCLIRLSSDIPDICTFAENVADEDLGVGLPGLALASSLHETQYSRLFRS